jgi:hypothetical protein
MAGMNSISLKKINNSNLKEEKNKQRNIMTVDQLRFEFFQTRVDKKWRIVVDYQSVVRN